jgi:hypothetical protein
MRQGEIERNDGEAVLDSLDVGTLCKKAAVRRGDGLRSRAPLPLTQCRRRGCCPSPLATTRWRVS